MRQLPRFPNRSRFWLPLLRALILLGAPPLVAALTAQAEGPEPAAAADPSAAINSLIEKRWQDLKIAPAPPCDDRTFARRVYLDLAGRIPTPAEVGTFLAEAPAGRRAALVDRLLGTPEYARHMRDVFDVVFIGRGEAQPRRRRSESSSEGGRGQWLSYLERSFAENRPWDRLVKDIVLARPAGEAERGAVWFLYNRQNQYKAIAEAVSPAVFGVQIQCAQCHDHPQADEIKQAHYWGLVAFFNRGKNVTTRQGPRVSETATGGFSNFADLSGESKPAELVFLGGEKVPEARPAGDKPPPDTPDLYRPVLEGGSADEPKIPLFSRREQFVQRFVSGSPLVARAAVNRFWALLMGRGIVHPVDRMDSKHPPAHPELLDWLAKDFTASGFDVRRLVRAIVLSRPYQLDSRRLTAAQPDSFAYALEKPLTAEALYRSLLVAATGKAEGENPELRDALTTVFPEVFPEENLSTLRQSMFLTNNRLVHGLVQAKTGTTAERLAAIPDPAERVREAFRAAYGRGPDGDELKESLAYLAARGDRPKQATEHLWWALLAGAEFRFNH